MNGHSNERPPKMADLGGRTLFNYDIVERVDGETPGFSFKTICVIGTVDRDKLIRALISERFSIENEIALINNYIAQPANYEQEYQDYQLYRSICKTIATQLIE